MSTDRPFSILGSLGVPHARRAEALGKPLEYSIPRDEKDEFVTKFSWQCFGFYTLINDMEDELDEETRTRAKQILYEELCEKLQRTPSLAKLTQVMRLSRQYKESDDVSACIHVVRALLDILPAGKEE